MYNGSTFGKVTYSNADEAALAMKQMNETKGLIVGAFNVDSKELREAHENIRSDILLEQPPSLLQPRLYDLPSQSFPSRLDTQHLPAHDKVCKQFNLYALFLL